MRIVWGLVLIALAASAQDELSFRPPEIVPVPKSVTYEENVAVRIGANAEFAVSCPDAAAVAWVAGKAKAWFGVSPKVVAAGLPQVDGPLADWQRDEAYILRARPGRIEISAATLQGVKYAMHTLRQAAEREGGVRLTGYRLPALEVKDWPSLRFRGLHICWFPENGRALIERMIRLAAYYKFNYAVIENWGVFRSERYPFMSVPDAPLTGTEAKRLAALAKDLGVTLVPQVNAFGHAALARQRGGKHAILDFHPELQPLFEPDGWNWCLSNPEAVGTIRGFIAELHEAFGNPPFVHIGCDEADPPTCAACRGVKSYAAVLGAHIRGIAEMLHARGARTMMWHDMMLERGDPRWATPEGATERIRAFGTKESAAVLETLPKDIVICDWYYGSKLTDFPTLRYFQSRGFDTVTCPWKDLEGIGELNGFARRQGLFGSLQTLWHHFRGRGFASLMVKSACTAWGEEELAFPAAHRRGYPTATHWRQLGWDMGVTDYEDTGFFDRQVTRDVLAE